MVAALRQHGWWPEESGAVRLVLSPHRSLHLFPLHACPLAGGGFLGDRFEVAYTPSLSMLRRCARRRSTGAPTAPDEVLLTGNPTHDLVFAEAETQALGRHYPGQAPAVGPAVTSRLVLERAGRSRRWNYSGHANYDWNSPLDSALFLAAGGKLSLRQVFRDLHFSGNDLTVINGCEGALLMPKPTDDHVNLVTGMLYAGARCVVSTLWQVNDLSAALLSDRFHAELAKGRTPAAALRVAQIWLRDEIRDGQYLMERVMREFLEHVPNKELQQKCEAAAKTHAAAHPNTPPFASPVHWAAFIASGLAFPVAGEAREGVLA